MFKYLCPKHQINTLFQLIAAHTTHHPHLTITFSHNSNLTYIPIILIGITFFTNHSNTYLLTTCKFVDVYYYSDESKQPETYSLQADFTNVKRAFQAAKTFVIDIVITAQQTQQNNLIELIFELENKDGSYLYVKQNCHLINTQSYPNLELDIYSAVQINCIKEIKQISKKCDIFCQITDQYISFINIIQQSQVDIPNKSVFLNKLFHLPAYFLHYHSKLRKRSKLPIYMNVLNNNVQFSIGNEYWNSTFVIDTIIENIQSSILEEIKDEKTVQMNQLQAQTKDQGSVLSFQNIKIDNH